MRRFSILAGLGLVVVAVGCIPGCKRDVAPDQPVAATTEKPAPAQHVAYMNENARLVQSIKSTKVEIQATQGKDTVGLEGSLFCQKPRNFRLRADVVGKPAVDIGSNDNEFWFWISQDKDPADGVARVHYCSYQDMAAGKVRLPFPFQPDMIVAALGMGEYDPNKEYTLKEDARTISLVEQATSAQGLPVQKVTVFNKTRVQPGKPQVLAYLLLDDKGAEVCRASILDVQAVQMGDATAVLPQRVELAWRPQQLTMKMRLYETQANSIDPQKAAKLFSRADLASIPAINLAQGADAPGGVGREMSIQRAGLNVPVK